MIISSLIFWPFLLFWYMTVLCFALLLALPLTVYFENYSALSSSLMGFLVLFYFSFSILFMGDLRLSYNFTVSLCWRFAYLLFFSDLTPLVVHFRSSVWQFSLDSGWQLLIPRILLFPPKSSCFTYFVTFYSRSCISFFFLSNMFFSYIFQTICTLLSPHRI